MKLLIVLILGFHYSVFANSSLTQAAIGAGALTAVSTGAVNISHKAYLNSELESWKNLEGDTTTYLTSSCGVTAESRLIGSNRSNYVYLVIKNTSDRKYTLEPNDIALTFDQKRRRTSVYQVEVSNVVIDKNTYLQILVPFPEKSDFKDKKNIKVSVPLLFKDNQETCVVDTFHKRYRDQKKSEYTAASTLDYYLDLGAVLSQEGDRADVLEGAGRYFGLEAAIYLNPNHGFWFGLGGENSESSELDGSQGEKIKMNSLFATLGYSYRHFFSKKSNFVFQTGLGTHTYDQIEDRAQSKTQSSGLSVVNKVGYDHVVGGIQNGQLKSDFSLGVSLNHLYVTGDDFEDYDHTGNGSSLFLVFRLKMGI